MSLVVKADFKLQLSNATAAQPVLRHKSNHLIVKLILFEALRNLVFREAFQFQRTRIKYRNTKVMLISQAIFNINSTIP